MKNVARAHICESLLITGCLGLSGQTKDIALQRTFRVQVVRVGLMTVYENLRLTRIPNSQI